MCYSDNVSLGWSHLHWNWSNTRFWGGDLLLPTEAPESSSAFVATLCSEGLPRNVKASKDCLMRLLNFRHTPSCQGSLSNNSRSSLRYNREHLLTLEQLTLHRFDHFFFADLINNTKVRLNIFIPLNLGESITPIAITKDPFYPSEP